MQALEPPRQDAPGPAEHLTELKFSELELAPEVQRGIADAGFTYCTPIQSKTLPVALAGRDVAGQAQTGTGKTAAFLIALFQHLLTHEPLESRDQGPRALILAPTRELAVQIHNDASVLGRHLPFTFGLAFGGTDYEKQKRQLAAGVDVLIGTPGRLIDFFKQGIFTLRRVQVAVLDEADRMFDLGFLRDIRYILRRLPKAEQRLNLLFSATLSYRVLELAYEHMNDPELVRIEPDKLTVDRVRQRIYFPSNQEKLPLLVSLLKEMDAKRTMVFVNTRREADRVRDRLEQAGIQAAALSGDVPQRKRLSMLRDFQAGELSVLIATDVASRGLHVPDVSHVFNYDLPQDPEDYVHRVGRTARAGASGDAISFGCEDYVVSLPDIEAYIGRKIPVASFDPATLEELPPPAPRTRPRREGRRESERRRDSERRGRGRPRGGEPRDGAAAPAGDEANASPESERGQDRVEGQRRRRRRRRGASTETPREPSAEPGGSPADAAGEAAGTEPSAEPEAGPAGAERPAARKRRRQRRRKAAGPGNDGPGEDGPSGGGSGDDA